MPAKTEAIVLGSPNGTTLRSVAVGDRLPIEFRPGPPQLLVVMAKSGSAAGAINSASRDEIIASIINGETFVAEVQELRGLHCKVLIRPKRRPR